MTRQQVEDFLANPNIPLSAKMRVLEQALKTETRS